MREKGLWILMDLQGGAIGGDEVGLGLEMDRLRGKDSSVWNNVIWLWNRYWYVRKGIVGKSIVL
ncbi:hypothetical protein SESBI_37488 [Sesbania bispinosa]|nr:hypothetical protein SESBI_37488 [Sesbania bispinosa]